MSKKLIAIASAAALALAALVAVPAGATTITQVVVTHGGTAHASAEPAGNSTTLTTSQVDSTSAFTIASDNTDRKVNFGNTTNAVTRNSVRAVVTTGAAATLNITATAGVKVAVSTTDSAGAALDAVAGGSTTLTGTTTDSVSTYTFYAWTTSTTAGSVTVDSGSSKIVFYVKAKVGPAYNLADVVYPTSLYTGQTDAKVTFKMTDQWGNAVSTGTGPTPTGFGAALASAATYNATTKLWSAAVGTVSADNVAINLAITPTDLSANGFAKPVKSSFKLISAGDLAAQVTTLTAQVAALTATVSALTADYNSVAKKYNKLVKKSKRVVLK
jgi:hypothetical protein